MKQASWITHVAWRYISARRRSGGAPSSLLSILGIATGVMALIVVISVMNGFQLGFIESILNISSYHVRVELSGEAAMQDDPAAFLREDRRVQAALPFMELQTLIRGSAALQQAALVRGIPADSERIDPSLAEALHLEKGSLDLSQSYSIILGAELAWSLNVRLGDTVTLLVMSGSGSGGALIPENAEFLVSGIFRSGFYEYDVGWAFISLPDARELSGAGPILEYGIKLRDRWRDQSYIESLTANEQLANTRIQSWREFNRSFFGALRTEKILMFFLMGLIFVVVALNIYQSQRRAVLERYDEIGLLRAVGASPLQMRMVFVFDGFLTGILGALIGLVPGLLISAHIAGFFTLLETVVNSISAAAMWILNLFSGGSAGMSGNFSIFSPAVFYLKEIPSRVIPAEILAISLFAVLSATAAAWFASKKAAGIKPAEVLRYE